MISLCPLLMYQLAVQLLYQTWSLVYRTLRPPWPNVELCVLVSFTSNGKKGNFSIFVCGVPYEVRKLRFHDLISLLFQQLYKSIFEFIYCTVLVVYKYNVAPSYIPILYCSICTLHIIQYSRRVKIRENSCVDDTIGVYSTVTFSSYVNQYTSCHSTLV